MKIFSNKFVVFLLSVVVVSLLIFLHFRGSLKPAENFIVTSIKPIQYGFNSVGNRIANFFSTIGSIGDLQNKNKELEQEVLKLNAEIAKLKEFENENKVLREQLGFAQSSNYKLLPAEIIGREPEDFFQYLIIAKGEKDGVKNGMFVLSSGQLVGKITETYKNSSKLLLITNPSSSVGAMIQGSRATGIVKGAIGGGLVMEMIPQNEVVRTGDTVVTSGLGGDYPKGLVLGNIESIESKPDELFQKANIKSQIDFKKLEMVFIVL
jgi:rod shape-determining protein MreC